MASAPPYTLTNETITVVWEGQTHVIQMGTAQFISLRKAITSEDWDSVPKYLTVAKGLSEWAKGKVTIKGENFFFDGEEIPRDINARIIKMATSGEDPTPLFKFWERLKKNPSFRSVQQLWSFMEHRGIPLTKDGCFLAYKSVRQDYKDVHSGEFDNSPGVINEMPRNKISDDPKVECHEGFHVGALEYAKTFHSGGRIVVCKVDPQNVVCVPYDSSSQKMRVCRYRVLGNHNGSLLPDTTFLEDKDDPEIDDTPEGYDPETDPLAYDDDELLENADKALKADKPSKKEPKRASKKGFTKFDKMGTEELFKQSIEDLRRYAGKGLVIVGASKIPGGKTALVSRILEVRK